MIRVFEKVLIFVFVAQYIEFARCDDGYISVVGPKLVRPTVPYEVLVTSYDLKESTFLISIDGNSSSRTPFDRSETITLEGTDSKKLKFDLHDISPGDYQLKVKSRSGIEFDKHANLGVNTKKHSIFIQTDKAMYKPKDKVQFRVLLLDADTKPVDGKNMKVFLTDAESNRIKQFLDVHLKKGVFKNELQLSDSPVLGKWKINVEIDGKIETKAFEIAEYVLPKFEIKLEVPPFVVYKDEKFTATVRAKYTYGKPVKGEVRISASIKSWYAREEPVSKVVPVDGKGSVEFDLHKEILVHATHHGTINLHASFTEELTGYVQNATAEVQIFRERHKINIKKPSTNFKPGLPYKYLVEVLYQDNTPVIDNHNNVNVKILFTNSWHTGKFDIEKSYNVLNGIVEVEIDTPRNQSRIYLDASYLGVKKSDSVAKETSTSEEYVLARVKTVKPKINEDVLVEVMGTEEFSKISYLVVARGVVVLTDSVSVVGGSSATFSFKANFQMIPKSNLIVYYVRKDGDMISDHVAIEFSKEFVNFIKLDTSSERPKPGQNVTISVETLPNSYVGLLGVDQSVLLLKKGNDLEPNEVFSEMDKYKSFNQKFQRHAGRSYAYDYRQRPRQRVQKYNKFKHFDSSDLIILTNSKGEPKHDGYYPRGPIGWNENALYAAPSSSRVGAAYSPMSRPNNAYRPVLFSLESDRVSSNTIETEPNVVVTRTEFPETWIFDDIDISESGIKTLSKQVPDTITSWFISGFSVNQEFGLGLTTKPTELNVFQPFFISTNLPYSIKRGEIVAVSLSVFNYLEQDLDAEVFLENEDNEYEFVGINEDGNQQKQIKQVLIKSNSGSTVSFMIKPLIVGDITIKATALSRLAGDKIEKKLLVEPEGITQYMNKGFLIDLRENNEFIKNIEVKIPSDAVPDSVKIEAGVIGDVFGPTIKNMDKLIKMPYGCGEQNMLNFVPNIVILDYLTTVNQLKPEIESKLLNHLESGYQRELTYKHPDGSYSAFGKSDKSGSTWLTAFVAKSFEQASKYIDIDKKIISEALVWLSSKQKDDGSFPEVGTILDRKMQGGSGKGVALTAYTLISFLQKEEDRSKYKETISKALNFIMKNIESVDDTYSQSIAAYALQLAQHNSKGVFLVKIDNKSVTKDGTKFWKRSESEEISSTDIEMTSYAMLTFIEAGLETESLPIMKWLISQRNENGGFKSTQDTVVGLQALAKLAKKVYVPESNVEVLVENHDKQEAKIHVNKQNMLVLQKYELPEFARDITIKARGSGIVMAQIAYKFNIDLPEVAPKFMIDVNEKENSNPNLIKLEVCGKFTGNSEKSNMAVMEVSLPSGFSYDTESGSSILNKNKVKKIETKHDDSVVMIYFDDFDKDGNCVDLLSYRVHKVADQKPSSIVLYDYYDTTRRASTFYSLGETNLCDICDDCETCLVNRLPNVPTESKKDFSYFTDVNRPES